jgi:hypothetical protein
MIADEIMINVLEPSFQTTAMLSQPVIVLSDACATPP